MQHRHRGQTGVVLIKAGHHFPQIDRHPLGDARGDPQHPPLTARARQRASLQRARRRCEVDRRHLPAAEYLLARLHRDCKEILAGKPRTVPDQQLNSRLQAQQAFRPRPQRRREVIEARSKSGSPLTTWPMPLFWAEFGPGSRTSVCLRW